MQRVIVTRLFRAADFLLQNQRCGDFGNDCADCLTLRRKLSPRLHGQDGGQAPRSQLRRARRARTVGTRDRHQVCRLIVCHELVCRNGAVSSPFA